jgi:hypothetical protein
MPAKGNDDDHQMFGGAAAAAAISLSVTKKDLDSLVYDIKENLKLSSSVGGVGNRSGGKHKSVDRRRSGAVGGCRPSPYSVPPSSRVPCDNADPKCQSQLRKWNHQRRRYPSTCVPDKTAGVSDLDDPFAMLQELITDGSLIKEAVRRLQLGLSPKLAMLATASSGDKRQDVDRSFYDSDDECRTPPAVDYPEDDMGCEQEGVMRGEAGGEQAAVL